MKVTPKVNEIIGLRKDDAIFYVHLKKRQIWTCRESKYDKERYILEHDNVSVNMSKEEMESIFKEIK